MEFQPAKQRMIKDLKEEDQRVQITGYIDEIEEEKSFLLEDGTGKIKVLGERVKFSYSKDDLVNVFGQLSYKEDKERVLEAEIIQDMKGLNFEYYKKLYEIKKQYL
jgi:uncharacterized protein YdeI (BOF family)